MVRMAVLRGLRDHLSQGSEDPARVNPSERPRAATAHSRTPDERQGSGWRKTRRRAGLPAAAAPAALEHPAVLSAADHAFWKQNGYLVVPDAVPAANCAAVLAEMRDFLRIPTFDTLSDEWYQCSWPQDTRRPSGWVHMRQTQGVWDNRQCPKVHQVFSELIGVRAAPPCLPSEKHRQNHHPAKHPHPPRARTADHGRAGRPTSCGSRRAT